MAMWLIKVLLGVYIVITLMLAYQKNWPLCLYWIGASIIQASIIVMNKGEM
jgi:uncharacterized membrane protein (DUF485 family)